MSDTAAEGSVPQMPPGVFLGGPEVEEKIRESRLLVGSIYAGAIAGLIWAVTQGVDRVEIGIFAVMFAWTTIGIGAGVHRLLVHRSFRCGPVMRTLFCAAGQMAVQGSLLKWVANHRRHHLYADVPGDPHSPHYDGRGNRYLSVLKGLLHGQGGWVFDDTLSDADHYAKDILADPIAMHFTRWRWFWYGMSMVFVPAAVGYAFGGIHEMIGCILFSGFFRTYVVLFFSSLTGSVCHSFGYRRYEVDDESTNEVVTMFLTFGEGLHNNHHRFPRDAYLAHAWYEFDLNGLLILGLAKLGLVSHVFSASKRHLAPTNEEPSQVANHG